MDNIEKTKIIFNYIKEIPFLGLILGFLLAVFIFCWLDGQSGYTFHYFHEKKIEEISKYTKMKKKNINDSIMQHKIDILIDEIIQKKRISAYGDFKRYSIRENIIFSISYSWLSILFALLVYKKRILSFEKPTLFWLLITICSLITFFILHSIQDYFGPSSSAYSFQAYCKVALAGIIAQVTSIIVFLLVYKSILNLEKQLEESKKS